MGFFASKDDDAADDLLEELTALAADIYTSQLTRLAVNAPDAELTTLARSCMNAAAVFYRTVEARIAEGGLPKITDGD